MTVTSPFPTRTSPPAVRAGADRAARGSDRLLDLVVAAFGGWTLAYDVCVLTRLGTGWAAAGGAVVAVAACAVAWLATGEPAGTGGEAWSAVEAAGPARRSSLAGRAAVLVVVAPGVAAGVLFAFTRVPYVVVWALWLAAALGAILVAGRHWPVVAATARRVTWPEIGVVAVWAVGLAVFSLLLLDPDADDAFYVHLSTWISAHGQFPLRDVVFADRRFPALYFPPLTSYEPLVGTVSRLSGIAAPDVAYLGVPPLGTVLSVLAFWRLLRTWRVPMAALALTTTLVFLLFDAGDHMWYGSFFVSRMWQGKVLLLTLGVPLLFSLLHDHVRRPTVWRAGLLALASVTCVGLSTTAIFLVPVIAVGAMAPVALRTPWRALTGVVAAVAYPLGAGAVAKLAGGRTPDVYTAADVVSPTLVHYVVGTGAFALIALGASLAGPALLPHARAGRMVAGSVLLAGILLAPPVPEQLFDLTGLGRVLWRLTWALPAAALVGAVAVCLLPRGPRLLRAAPAVLLCVAIVPLGRPLWSIDGSPDVLPRPVLKRLPSELTAARRILRVVRPGDVVLARRPLSQTILILSADVTTVSPRQFFTRALGGQPGMHVPARLRLAHYVRFGLRRVPATPQEIARLREALTLVGVDIVCQSPSHVAARQALAHFGFRPVLRNRHYACARAPAAIGGS